MTNHATSRHPGGIFARHAGCDAINSRLCRSSTVSENGQRYGAATAPPAADVSDLFWGAA